MRKFTLFLMLVFATMAMAQVTTIPSIIQKGYDGEVTVVFNPNEGNKGMAEATQCYAHTGITYNGKSWQNTSGWRDGKDKYKMTKNAEGNWELKITPNIYTYYGVSQSTDVTQLCFVFNDGPNGQLEGKSESGGDIFVDLVEAGLAVNIAASMPEIASLGETVTLHCNSTESAQLTLTLNGDTVQTAEGTELVYQHTLENAGKYLFEFTATNASGTKTTTASTWVPMTAAKQNRPEGVVNGIYYDGNDPTKVTLCTYAGSKIAASMANEDNTITVKAKIPAHWKNTITAYVWDTESSKVVTPTKEGDWYVVTEKCATLNIIFRNGTDWSGNANQTEDILLSSNTNIQISQSGSDKATYKVLERDILVQAQMPEQWNQTITALVTPAGGTETVVTPELKNGWYTFAYTCKDMTVVFRNGDGTEDCNQSQAITLSENTTLKLTQEGESKAVCNIVIANPAKHVFVVGDFNDWTISDEYQLKQANDSAYFWIEIDGLTPQKEYAYQYVVVRADGQVKRISDLYSEKLLHPDDEYEPKKLDPTLMDYPKEADGYVTVIQTNKPEYNWSDATLNFKRPDKNNLIIYELWVYDYTPTRSLKAVQGRLDYLKSLGVNAIELMPLSEFDGNYNWGYSPNHYFAFDKAYGKPEDLKDFVEACHKEGIAVIVDMVFNHATGLNPMNKLYPYGEDLQWNPWFNAVAPHSDVFYEDWNHDFAPTKTMFTRALQYWLKEYKIDGFRMDLSHGLCGTTNNALTHLFDYYRNGVKAVSEDAYFILEHWGSSASSDWTKLINEGMMCWQNTSDAYHKATAGNTSSSFSGANKRGFVSYCESHDEERMQYYAKKNGVGDIKTNEEKRLSRIAANVIFNVLLAGPHMLWQYEEIGYDFSINSSENSPNGTSSDDRCAKKPRPETRGYFTHPIRMDQFTKVAQAIQLRTQLMAEQFIALQKPTKNTLSGALRSIQWGSDVFVAANFHASESKTATIPDGTWYNYYAQSQQTAKEVSLAPGEVIILTGSQVTLPEINLDFCFLTGVENIVAPNPTEILPPYNVQVYTLSGQLVMRQNNVMVADLTALNTGLYIVQYEKNGQRVAKKVIR